MQGHLIILTVLTYRRHIITYLHIFYDQRIHGKHLEPSKINKRWREARDTSQIEYQIEITRSGGSLPSFVTRMIHKARAHTNTAIRILNQHSFCVPCHPHSTRTPHRLNNMEKLSCYTPFSEEARVQRHTSRRSLFVIEFRYSFPGYNDREVGPLVPRIEYM